MKPVKSVLVVYFAKYYDAFLLSRKILSKSMKVYVSARERESYIKAKSSTVDAVVVVGGDGTLLRVSHLVEDTPVLHVNSGTKSHEGFFSRASPKDLAAKARLLALGKYRILRLLRLKSAINGRPLPYLALNEVFAGSTKAYNTARYVISDGRRSEFQKSSGVIVYTPAGSHAWAASAGAKKIALSSQKFGCVVREPYIGRYSRPKMLKGTAGSDSRISIISRLWKGHSGIVVIDSYKKEFAFNFGDRLEVRPGRHFSLIDF